MSVSRVNTCVHHKSLLRLSYLVYSGSGRNSCQCVSVVGLVGVGAALWIWKGTDCLSLIWMGVLSPSLSYALRWSCLYFQVEEESIPSNLNIWSSLFADGVLRNEFLGKTCLKSVYNFTSQHGCQADTRPPNIEYYEEAAFYIQYRRVLRIE